MNLCSQNRAVFLAFLLLAVPACGDRSITVGEVEGTLRWNKKPMKNVQVQFIPDVKEGSNAPRSTAVTDDQGHYTLYLDDGQPGAVVGNHSVLLFEIGNDPDRDRNAAEARHAKAKSRPTQASPGHLLDRYNKAATTPLKREVYSGKQTINLDLP
jgi:hypothetical protein